MDPSGQIVLSITGDPCNVRRAGFFGGGSCLFPSAELTSRMRALRRQGALTPPSANNHTDDQAITYTSPHPLFPFAKRATFGGTFHSLIFYVERSFSLVPDQHHSRCCCRCVLEQDTLESCRDPGEMSKAGLTKGQSEQESPTHLEDQVHLLVLVIWYSGKYVKLLAPLSIKLGWELLIVITIIMCSCHVEGLWVQIWFYALIWVYVVLTWSLFLCVIKSLQTKLSIIAAQQFWLHWT